MKNFQEPFFKVAISKNNVKGHEKEVVFALMGCLEFGQSESPFLRQKIWIRK